MNTITPVNHHEREVFMDVLRGLAILGIFIANLNFFSFYNPQLKEGLFIYPQVDRTVSYLQAMFIEGKFYSIFSLLFGWGIALQLKRSKLKDTEAAAFIRRRLWIMLLLGGIHLVFIWIGDIVAFYAMIGFVLVALRNVSTKKLLYTGFILILSPILLYYLKVKFNWLNAPADALFNAANTIQAKMNGITQTNTIEAALKNTDSFITTIKINMGDVFFRYGYLFFVSRIPKVLGMMLIGFVVGRTAIFKQWHQYKKQIWMAIIIGSCIALPANYMLAHYMQTPEHYYTLTIEGWYETVAYAFGVAPLAMVYVLVIGMLFHAKATTRLFQIIAPVGRMAFTNYMMHSIVGIVTFYGAGLGYMQQFGTAALTAFGIGIFLCQIVWSNIWLKHFEFGPVEWVWRCLTYQCMQPFKRKVMPVNAVMQ